MALGQALSITTPDPVNNKNRKHFSINFSVAAAGYTGDFLITEPFQSGYGYKIFVTYGDGTFEMFKTSSVSATSPVFEFFHDYCCSSSNGFPVEVELTKIYTRDDEVLRVANGTVTGTLDLVPSVNPSPFPAVDGEFFVRFDVNRTPVPGYPFTVMVTTIDTFTDAVTGIRLGYDSDNLKFIDSTLYYGEVFSQPSADELLVLFNGSMSTPVNHNRNLFFTFEVLKEAELGNALSFDLTFEHDSLSAESVEEIARVSHSFDPNYKIANIDTIVHNQCEILEYVIHFENIGPAPTNTIVVSDVFDDFLRFDDACAGQSLTMDVVLGGKKVFEVGSQPSGYMGNLYMEEVDCSAKQLTWDLDPGEIRGQEEVGYGRDFREMDTWGEIRMKIRTDCSLAYGDVIPNVSTIQFDNNFTLTTDTSRVLKFCCQGFVPNSAMTSIFPSLYFTFPGTFDPNTLQFIEATYPGDSSVIGVVPGTGLITYQDGTVSSHLDILTVAGCDDLGNCDTIEITVCVGDYTHVCDLSPCVPESCSLGVGVDEYWEDVEAIGVLAYPNPMGDILHVAYGDALVEVRRMALYDIQGRLVREIAVDRSGEAEVYVGDLEGGIYLLRVNDSIGYRLVRH